MSIAQQLAYCPSLQRDQRCEAGVDKAPRRELKVGFFAEFFDQLG
jgi:hypothetical protein